MYTYPKPPHSRFSPRIHSAGVIYKPFGGRWNVCIFLAGGFSVTSYFIVLKKMRFLLLFLELSIMFYFYVSMASFTRA
jgi:hypothetical protein